MTENNIYLLSLVTQYLIERVVLSKDLKTAFFSSTKDDYFAFQFSKEIKNGSKKTVENSATEKFIVMKSKNRRKLEEFIILLKSRMAHTFEINYSDNAPLMIWNYSAQRLEARNHEYLPTPFKSLK